ncbi:unnamed protein product, partial [Mesorhabditis spiculigera]
MFWAALVFSTLLNGVTPAGSATTARGQWTLTKNGTTCIMMWAQIDLTLSYYSGTGQEQVDVPVQVPAAATTDGDCDAMLYLNGNYIKGQVLKLNFDSKAHLTSDREEAADAPTQDWNGWSATFAFARVEELKLGDNQWMLLQVNITANYTTDPAHFKIDGNNPVHTYYQHIDPAEPPDLADSIYASNGYSLNCPSKQKFAINSDPKYGPLAYIQFSLLKKLKPVPLISTTPIRCRSLLGGVLAGLTVLTLCVYLFYRARLPPEIINTVNPHSHYENKGTSAPRAPTPCKQQRRRRRNEKRRMKLGR